MGHKSCIRGHYSIPQTPTGKGPPLIVAYMFVGIAQSTLDISFKEIIEMMSQLEYPEICHFQGGKAFDLVHDYRPLCMTYGPWSYILFDVMQYAILVSQRLQAVKDAR